jgi:hypothetical protein
MGTRHWPEDADNEVERLEGIITRLREKLKIAEKALVIACDNAREYEEYLFLDGEEALAAIRSE